MREPNLSTTELILKFIQEEILFGQYDEELEPDTNLLLTGLVDSLGIMRLVLHLEGELGVSIPPEDIVIENFLTVAHMTRYLKGIREAA